MYGFLVSKTFGLRHVITRAVSQASLLNTVM